MKRAVCAAIAALLWTIATPQVASAATGPWIVVAHWNYSSQCISGEAGENYLETVDKDTLPNEWTASTDPAEALKAGASIIRTDAYYFHVTTNSDLATWCAGVTHFTYDFRGSRMEALVPLFHGGRQYFVPRCLHR